MQAVPVVGYVQDMQSQQSGDRKSMRWDYDFVVIAGYGLIIILVDYVVFVVARDFDTKDETRTIVIILGSQTDDDERIMSHLLLFEQGTILFKKGWNGCLCELCS